MVDIEITARALLGPLSVTSIYPYFLISGLLLYLSRIVARNNQFYRELLTAENNTTRFHSIDGLRGFLALGVFFHHAVINFFFYKDGSWDVPPSQFFTLIGQVGVALFFMITAFLFWTKGIQARPFLRTQPFLWSRLVRLVPMYTVSIICVFGVAFVESNFQIHESAAALAREGLSWMSFGFVKMVDINGLRESGLINNVYWTLSYEWMFYLILPLGLIFARGFGFFLMLIISAVAIHEFSVRQVEWNFLFGILAALAVGKRVRGLSISWDSWPISILVMAILAVVFTKFDRAYGWRQSSLLFLCFLCIANGNSLFGVLTCRAGRMLGAVSYSIYLMHCVVLYIVLKLVNVKVPINTMVPAQYWSVIAIGGAILVLISLVTFRFIEHPIMRVPMPEWLGNDRSISSEINVNDAAPGQALGSG